MPDVNYLCLLLVTAVTLLAWTLSWRRLRSGAERLFMTVCMAGLFFYSGIGGAYVPVAWDYCVCYCVFAVMFSVSFTWGVSVARQAAVRQRAAYEHIERVGRSKRFRNAAIGLYFVITLVPLVYPDFRLSLLWNPPAPDMLAVFNRGIALDTSVSLKTIGYVAFLVSPFYLVAMYSLRRRYIALAIATVAPAYCRYCSIGYLGRGELVICVALYSCAIWLDRPSRRGRLAIVSLVCLPFLVIFFEGYSRVRLGDRSVSDLGAVERIERVLASTETSFPASWSSSR